MELSSKITRSVYLYLEKEGEIAGEVLENSGLSPELALDSERWIKAPQVEKFLEEACRAVTDFSPKSVAIEAPQLKGWGLLDQVLRIVQSPVEIYQQPEKFLSYFVKPGLPVEWVKRTDSLSSFLVPVSSEQFPLIAEYLSGALEVIAVFSGSELAHASWHKHTITVDWKTKQESIFEENQPVNLRPRLYKEMVQMVEKQQTELIQLKEQFVTSDVTSLDSITDKDELLNELKVLQDYFLRSRQLVALLKAQSGEKKWFKEALKRLNWDELQGLYSNKMLSIEEKLTTSSESHFETMPNQNLGKQENLNLSI